MFVFCQDTPECGVLGMVVYIGGRYVPLIIVQHSDGLFEVLVVFIISPGGGEFRIQLIAWLRECVETALAWWSGWFPCSASGMNSITHWITYGYAQFGLHMEKKLIYIVTVSFLTLLRLLVLKKNYICYTTCFTMCNPLVCENEGTHFIFKLQPSYKHRLNKKQTTANLLIWFKAFRNNHTHA